MPPVPLPPTPPQVQSFPAPFKIIHDASCAAPPTLQLGLHTTLSGGTEATGGILPACVLLQKGKKATATAELKQVCGGACVGGPYDCFNKALVDADCSKVARQISHRHSGTGNGYCYCATDDLGFATLADNSDYNIWHAPSGTGDVADSRCA